MGLSIGVELPQALLVGLSFAADDKESGSDSTAAALKEAGLTAAEAHEQFYILNERVVSSDVSSQSLAQMGDSNAQPLLVGVIQTASNLPRLVGMQTFKQDGEDKCIIRTAPVNCLKSKEIKGRCIVMQVHNAI